MNMGFSISNLTIIAMTLCIGFCTNDTDEPHREEYNWNELAVYTASNQQDAYEACIDELEDDGYLHCNSGYENFILKIPDFKRGIYVFDSENFREFFKNKINKKYKTLDKSKRYAIAYYFSLAIQASKINHMLPTSTWSRIHDHMLPTSTWCRIHGSGTYDAVDFLKNNTIQKKYSRLIASNTGLSKKEQTLVYRTINVCFRDIALKDQYSYFFNLYQDWNIKFYHVNTHHDFLKTSIIYKNYVPSYIHFLETEDSNNNYINSYVAFLEHLKRKNNYVPSRAEFLETFDTNKNYLPSYLHFLETEDSNNTIPYDNLTPSSWCAINACYESLINAGFLDVSAKKNIELVMLPTFKIKETYGYIYDFFQYLKNISKQPTDPSQILNPYDSNIEIQSGYLRNWCSVQVCHEQLVKAGFSDDNFVFNYYVVLPSINYVPSHLLYPETVANYTNNGSVYVRFQEIVFSNNEKPFYNFNKENISFQFVTEYSTFLKTYNSNMKILPKKPLQWCKFITTDYYQKT